MVECNSGSPNNDNDMLKRRLITVIHEQAVRSHHHFGASRLQSTELVIAVFPSLNCSNVAITGSWMVVSLLCIL
jgi:hypothetical protein